MALAFLLVVFLFVIALIVLFAFPPSAMLKFFKGGDEQNKK